MKKHLFVLPLVLSLAVTGLAAQTLSGLKIDPPQPMVGQSVTASISMSGDSPNCGLHFYWGDGTKLEVKVNDKTVLPLKLTHTYAAPGNFRTMVEGKRAGSSLKCMGANVVQTVTVVAPPPPPVPVASAAAAPVASAKGAGPSCPANWTLSAKSVNKKTGAYTCTAKAGTALPAARTVCPGDLGYFENVKKGQMGCRP